MPDHPFTPDTPDTRDERLDAQIATLVARAVADAPAPPELGEIEVVPAARPDRRRRWIGGAGAVLAAAASLVAVFVLSDDGDQSVYTPITTPTIPPEPTSITAPATPPVSEPPSPTTPVPTSPPTSIGTGQLLAVTGGDGISILNRGGLLLESIDEGADIAFAVGDGRVVFQTPGGASDGLAPADTTPSVWTDGRVAPLALAAGDTEYIEVHDVAVVDGRTIVIWTTYGSDANPDTYGDEHLWFAELGATPDGVDGPYTTGAPTDLGVVGSWESGPSRLHLAGDGLIVGTTVDSTQSALFVAAVSGSTAADYVDGLTPASLGLEEAYEDCAGCPSSFTVDSAARTMAWVSEDGMTRVPLDDGVPGDPITTPFPAARGGIEALELLDDGTVAATYSEFADPRRSAVLVSAGVVTDLPGLTVTEAPNTGQTPTPTTPSTTTTPPSSTPTTPPTEPAPVGYVTAGPAGVGVVEMGQEVRRLDQPAEIALLTPGGAVIFQPARTAPDQPPGDPQIWREDGSVENLLGPLAERQSYRLHDLATVDGVPTLLYGVESRSALDGPDVVPAEFTEVVHALTMTPGGWTTAQIAEVQTWEGGFSRLSLTDGGTIIGTHYEQLETSFYGAVVPGSPDDGEGYPSDPAPLGVEPSYSECEACPDDFTISADGGSVGWTEGTEMVVFDTASGEKRSWTVPSLAGQVVRSLDVRTSSDGGVEAAISFGWPNDETARTSVVVATSLSGEVVETPVAARMVTFGP